MSAAQGMSIVTAWSVFLFIRHSFLVMNANITSVGARHAWILLVRLCCCGFRLESQGSEGVAHLRSGGLSRVELRGAGRALWRLHTMGDDKNGVPITLRLR